MIVMFVRQELKQQNLPSDQQWQLHRLHQSQQQQAGQHFEERQAGQLQEGVIRLVDTVVKMGKLEVAFVVLVSEVQERWVEPALPSTMTA